MAVLNLQKAIRSLEKTPVILHTILKSMTQEEAMRATDGPDGWSVLFIVCHLRDCETIFLERVRMSVELDKPTLHYITNDELIQKNDYANQDFQEVRAELATLREQTLDYIRPLTEEQLMRTGIHPIWGENTALDYIVNIALHDIDHSEQLIKTLGYFHKDSL
jgi:hypothetical protein